MEEGRWAAKGKRLGKWIKYVSRYKVYKVGGATGRRGGRGRLKNVVTTFCVFVGIVII